ncbi:hypothetical protein [Campylobacter rectus]|nr:hypothetical protein [Campylobacter rectus]
MGNFKVNVKFANEFSSVKFGLLPDGRCACSNLVNLNLAAKFARTQS